MIAKKITGKSFKTELEGWCVNAISELDVNLETEGFDGIFVDFLLRLTGEISW